jgi:hypothetical protein
VERGYIDWQRKDNRRQSSQTGYADGDQPLHALGELHQAAGYQFLFVLEVEKGEGLVE